jgi:hypothetical protein
VKLMTKPVLISPLILCNTLANYYLQGVLSV